MVYGSNNETVLANYGTEIWNTVTRRFNNALRHGSNVFLMSPQELVANDICDPVKVFIKDEPHSLKKVLSGKYRGISSVSLVDQIVTRLLCSKQNKAEINTWESCPSKPGMGLHDEGMLVIASSIKKMLSKGVISETDVSGWDWSVNAWELLLDAEIRRRLAGAQPQGVFGFLLRVHAYCVANSVYVTSDGHMWEQIIPGAQLSGDYNTSSTNSRMRVAATLMARLWNGQPLLVDGQIPIMAMGDDSIEIDFPGLKEAMNDMGHVVRLVEQRDKLAGVHFCSQEFREDGLAYPETPEKTAFRFFSHKPTAINYLELRTQLLWYLRHRADQVKGIIEKLSNARVERAKKLHGIGSSESSPT